MAAHDPGQRFDARAIGDNHIVRVEPVGPAIERGEFLIRLSAAHGEIALDFFGVEDVQGPGPVESEIIGDIDERIDRPQPNRLEPPLHPIGTLPIADAFHEAQREGGREIRILWREIELDRNGTRKPARDRRHRLALQFAEPRRREVAGNAIDTRGIRAVGQEIDLDERVIERCPLRISRADGGRVRQIENAVMIIGQFEFGARTKHAVGFDAADNTLAECDLLARNISPWRGINRLHAGPRIGRAAHDLHQGGAPGIDETNPQATGVGVRLRVDDAGDHEILERGNFVVDVLDLETDFGQRRYDLVERGVGLDMILEPGEGEFHRGPKTAPGLSGT